MNTRESEFLSFVSGLLGRELNSLDLRQGDVSEWDSVMHLRLVLELEEKYAIHIPIDQVPKIASLRDFFELTGDKA